MYALECFIVSFMFGGYICDHGDCNAYRYKLMSAQDSSLSDMTFQNFKSTSHLQIPFDYVGLLVTKHSNSCFLVLDVSLKRQHQEQICSTAGGRLALVPTLSLVEDLILDCSTNQSYFVGSVPSSDTIRHVHPWNTTHSVSVLLNCYQCSIKESYSTDSLEAKGICEFVQPARKTVHKSNAQHAAAQNPDHRNEQREEVFQDLTDRFTALGVFLATLLCWYCGFLYVIHLKVRNVNRELKKNQKKKCNHQLLDQ